MMELQEISRDSHASSFFDTVCERTGRAVRHYQLPATTTTTSRDQYNEDFSSRSSLFQTFESSLSVPSLVWMKDRQCFVCHKILLSDRIMASGARSTGPPWKQMFVSVKEGMDLAICGESETQVARAVVSLIVDFLARPQPQRQPLTLSMDKSWTISVLTADQLQTILQAGCPVAFSYFRFTPEQSLALMTCSQSTLALTLSDCLSDDWNVDALTSRTKSFGNLTISYGTDLLSSEFHWNKLLQRLRNNRNQLFDTLTVMDLGWRALDLLQAAHQGSVHRLRLYDSSWTTAEACQALGYTVQQGWTPPCLFFSAPSKRFDPLPVMSALKHPNCHLTEFGLALRASKWNETVNDAFMDALHDNHSLTTLVLTCPMNYGFHKGDLTLARAIQQHAHIQCIHFHSPANPQYTDFAGTCLPALEYLLETDCHFRIEWGGSSSTSWWHQQLRPSLRYQTFARGVLDEMTAMTWFQPRRICFQSILHQNCRDNRLKDYDNDNDRADSSQRDKAKRVALLLSKHLDLLKLRI